MGESWVVRYPQGGVLWEFDAWVTGRSDGEVALRPTGRLRWINRRRFLRVATRRPAYVAPFPFLMNYQETSPPRFYEGTLTEIGGAGLRVDAPVRVAPGERVLVVVELAPDKVAEGTGIVRRAAPAAGGMTSLAVELVGLDTTEVAELTRQTQPVEPPVTGEPHPGRVVAERT
jgi:hypothetical protein